MIGNNRGGARPGAGRPHKYKKVAVTIRISDESASYLRTQKNQSEYIESLIKIAKCSDHKDYRVIQRYIKTDDDE